MARRKQTPILGDGLSPLPSGPCCLSSVEERRRILRERAKKWQREHPERAKEIRDKSRAKNPDKYKESCKKSSKKYYLNNADKCKSRTAEWISNHPESKKASQAKWAAKSPENGSERVKKWQRENPAKAQAIREKWKAKNREELKAYDKRRVEEMTDSYIAVLLTNGTSLKRSDLPQELVELKRKQLKIHRQLKNNES